MALIKTEKELRAVLARIDELVPLTGEGVAEDDPKNLELNLGHLDEPFRWSEDFGRFGNVCPIGFFGLGSGTEQPALHNPEFDFPDDILEVGMTMFWEIIRMELEGS